MSHEKTNTIVNKDNYYNDIENIDMLTFEYVKILHEYLVHVTKKYRNKKRESL